MSSERKWTRLRRTEYVDFVNIINDRAKSALNPSFASRFISAALKHRQGISVNIVMAYEIENNIIGKIATTEISNINIKVSK